VRSIGLKLKFLLSLASSLSCALVYGYIFGYWLMEVMLYPWKVILFLLWWFVLAIFVKLVSFLHCAIICYSSQGYLLEIGGKYKGMHPNLVSIILYLHIIGLTRFS
jgi:hypothetical protein